MNLQEGEVALPIEGHEAYFITNRGRVWSTKRNRWMTLAQKDGYYYRVYFPDWQPYVHTLVGKHFLPVVNVKGGCILHKEEELPYPEVNYVENLWVGTHKQNMEDKERKGRGTKGRKASAETRRKMSEVRTGKVVSAETRRKLSEVNKGKKATEETKRKLKEAWKKRKPASEETRKKMSEAQKKAWAKRRKI